MLVSVFSPKGGVGKTTIALALAEVLSKKYKVCAVEVDFSPGDFPALLKGIDPTRNILAFKHDILSVVQRPEGKKFDIIVGGYPEEHELLKREELNTIIEKLKKEYEYVIVDMQPGVIETTIDILNMSDKVLVVAEDNYLATVARINGVFDWLEINSLSDLKNFVFIRNKRMTNELVYIDKIKHFKPIVHDIPFYKKLKNFDDRRFQKNIVKLAGVISQNGAYGKNKKRFLFWLFRKK